MQRTWREVQSDPYKRFDTFWWKVVDKSEDGAILTIDICLAQRGDSMVPIGQVVYLMCGKYDFPSTGISGGDPGQMVKTKVEHWKKDYAKTGEAAALYDGRKPATFTTVGESDSFRKEAWFPKNGYQVGVLGPEFCTNSDNEFAI